MSHSRLKFGQAVLQQYAVAAGQAAVKAHPPGMITALVLISVEDAGPGGSSCVHDILPGPIGVPAKVALASVLRAWADNLEAEEGEQVPRKEGRRKKALRIGRVVVPPEEVH